MSRDVQTVLRLRVPVIARVGQRLMSVRDVLDFRPGAVIDLQRSADAPLDLLVNNKVIGQASAVRVEDRYGALIESIAAPPVRISALASDSKESAATAVSIQE